MQVGKIEIWPAAVKLRAPQATFDRTHIVQQCLLGDDMRLQVEVSDNLAKETINQVIAARLDATTDKYLGLYVVGVSRAGETKELKGRIKGCEAG